MPLITISPETRGKLEKLKENLQQIHESYPEPVPKNIWGKNICIGCRWTTPKNLGGDGILCDQSSMKKFHQCPGWVVSWYGTSHRPHKTGFTMMEVVEGNKL